MNSIHDVVVLGGGPAGEVAAEGTAAAGLDTVLVESALLGGECSYWACMPSKALIRAGTVLRAATAVDGARQAVTGGLKVSRVLARRDRIVDHWDDSGQAQWALGAGIGLLRGHARFLGPRRVQVTAADGAITELEARHAVIVATGSDPKLPDIPGLRAAEPWTSRDATSASAVPESLAIIGGGVVAAEMATAFASLGNVVTVLARSGMLSDFEDFAGEAVAAGLRRLGVDLRHSSPRRVERDDDGVLLQLPDGQSVRAAELLVATGRVPRTAELGLDAVGLTPGEPIEVDDTLRAPGTDWLYAVGDVNGRALLTHQGKYQARAAAAAIVARAAGDRVSSRRWAAHAATADHRAVPSIVFAEPEVATVGLTAQAARAQGLRIRVLDHDLAQLAGATTLSDDYEGHARLVIDDERNVVIGATFAGPGVAELVHAATIAIVGEVPLSRLWHAVPAFPTLSETWLRLLESDDRPR